METTEKAYSIGASTDLRTGTLSEVGLSSWERGEVIPKIFAWAKDEDGNIVSSRARRAFLIVNGDELDVQSGYSFPIAVPNSSGTLIVPREAVNAAGSRLGALINNPENTDIPLEVLQRARTRLNTYREMFQEEKGESVMDTPLEVEINVVETSTKEIETAVSVADYGEIGTPQKNCTNCAFNEGGGCERFDFTNGGEKFACKAWQPSEMPVNEMESEKAESNHQSKISIIKTIVIDWFDSVFGNKEEEIEQIAELVEEVESEKTIIPPVVVEENPTESTMKIFKNKAGRYVFIGRYSNNFRDNDRVPEIITRKAHIDYIGRVTRGEAELPELWIMHNKAWKVGKCTHLRWDENEKGQGFAMCFAMFDEDKDYIAESLAKSTQAMSHGYGEHPVQRDSADNTLITGYTPHEVTIAYPNIAANKLTTSTTVGVNKTMIENKREIEKALGLSDGHLDTLEAQNGKALELVGEQIASKTVTEQPVQEQPVNGELLETVAALVSGMESLQTSMTSLMVTVETQAKTIAELRLPIDAQVAKVANEASPEVLSSLLARAKGLSVVGRDEALIDGRTRLGKDEPRLSEDDQKALSVDSTSGHWC